MYQNSTKNSMDTIPYVSGLSELASFKNRIFYFIIKGWLKASYPIAYPTFYIFNIIRKSTKKGILISACNGGAIIEICIKFDENSKRFFISKQDKYYKKRRKCDGTGIVNNAIKMYKNNEISAYYKIDDFNERCIPELNLEKAVERSKKYYLNTFRREINPIPICLD